MVLETPDKATRRMLLQNIKKLRGHIKASLHLSPTEQANKALAFSQLKGKNLSINDHGDIVKIFIRGQQTTLEKTIELYRPADLVQHDLNFILNHIPPRATAFK